MKRIAAFLPVILILALSLPSVFADASTATLTDENRVFPGGKAVGSVTLSFEQAVKAVYVRFKTDCADFTVTGGGKSQHIEAAYLNCYLDQNDIDADLRDCVLEFDESANILSVTAFLSDEEVPSDVQIWQPPLDRADLMLCTTHADDEQLFFAGVLPFYTAKGYDVQVVYFTDHQNNPSRRQELLCGLWEVGIRNYPVINDFPDRYSETLDDAVRHLKKAGFSYDDAVAFQVEMIRRFEPLVVVGHDINGEYGHGQHKLNTASLIDAVKVSSDAGKYPESAEKFGVWEVKKLYLHLYEENPVVMDWDQPLEYFNGKTAFEMTQKGFSHHKSQHKTWFYKWIYGKNTPVTKATDIRTYSPCNYGLYQSAVGADENKNDFFENITETHRQKAEREAKEAAEREEEERKKAEDELISGGEERQSRENESFAAVSQNEESSPGNSKTPVVAAAALGAGAAVIILLTVLIKRRK